MYIHVTVAFRNSQCIKGGGGLKMKIKNEVEGLDLKEKEEKIDKNKIL